MTKKNPKYTFWKCIQDYEGSILQLEENGNRMEEFIAAGQLRDALIEYVSNARFILKMIANIFRYLRNTFPQEKMPFSVELFGHEYTSYIFVNSYATVFFLNENDILQDMTQYLDCMGLLHDNQTFSLKNAIIAKNKIKDLVKCMKLGTHPPYNIEI